MYVSVNILSVKLNTHTIDHANEYSYEVVELINNSNCG